MELVGMVRLLKRIKSGIMGRVRIAENAVKYIICRLLPYRNSRETWVICERGTDARDNGYAFYRYMVNMHPEIRIYYLITRDSADYPKVADHAVIYGSLKNYWVVAKADKIVSTHCYTALPVKHEKSWRMLGLAKRFYFLQHGIIKEKLPYLFGDRTQMRFFCSGAIPECTYIRANYRHPEKVVQCTGLARYDHLLPFSVKKQILVMPTWRRYLKNEAAFQESKYLQAWNALLRDESLLQFLSETETKLIFYPHLEMQPYLKCFTAESENVILADFDHYDVQKLLKESKLLVTDYSSVHFDFAYMNKPCIYYQFDAEQYHNQHYKEGYFHFEIDGFGAVVKDIDQLRKAILDSAHSDYEMDLQYQKRGQSFFAYHDQNNCERIYQAIMNV